MATATQTKQTTPTPEAAYEQFKETSEQILAAARKAGNLYLDGYEQAVDRAIELEQKVASLSQQEWLKSMIEAQADFSKEVADTYVTTARKLLK